MMIWIVDLILIVGLAWLLSLFACSKQVSDVLGDILMWIIILTLCMGSMLAKQS